MSSAFTLLENFLVYITTFEPFVWFMGALTVFGVCCLLVSLFTVWSD